MFNFILQKSDDTIELTHRDTEHGDDFEEEIYHGDIIVVGSYELKIIDLNGFDPSFSVVVDEENDTLDNCLGQQRQTADGKYLRSYKCFRYDGQKFMENTESIARDYFEQNNTRFLQNLSGTRHLYAIIGEANGGPDPIYHIIYANGPELEWCDTKTDQFYLEVSVLTCTVVK